MAMYSPCGNAALPALGFPIRESTGQRLFNASPWLIAVVHALHRLLVPRNPPCALTILTVILIETGDGKVPGHGDTRLLIGQLCSFQGPGGRRAPHRCLHPNRRRRRSRSLKTQQHVCSALESAVLSTRSGRHSRHAGPFLLPAAELEAQQGGRSATCRGSGQGAP